MKESAYKSYDDLPLFLNAKWGPRGNAERFRGERRNSEKSEPCRLWRGEKYGACDDEVPKEKFVQWVEKHRLGGEG